MAARRRSEGAKVHGRVQPLPVPAAVAPRSAQQGSAAAVVVGRLMAGSTAAAPLVDFPGNVNGPTPARSTVPMDGALVSRAVATGQGAVLVFEHGDPRLPIVTGLISVGQAATPFQELLVAPRTTRGKTGGPGGLPVEARLDGERVVLEGKREVVLKCGEASITLRSDGKMVLRGAYIETYSRGMNRIKGASVKIN